MIIETKYRDIPWGEASQCASQANPESMSWWNERRGKRLIIEVPGGPPDDNWLCQGPLYFVVDDKNRHGERYFVCPHCAEIGD